MEARVGLSVPDHRFTYFPFLDGIYGLLATWSLTGNKGLCSSFTCSSKDGDLPLGRSRSAEVPGTVEGGSGRLTRLAKVHEARHLGCESIIESVWSILQVCRRDSRVAFLRAIS